MKPNMGRLAVAAFAVMALIGSARPAHAVMDPVDLLSHGFQSIKESVRNGIASLFGGQQAETVTPPTPTDVVSEISGAHSSQFWGYLKDAGYDLASIDTSVGIIPDIKITFQLVRELSEADRDWLQQELEVDAMRRTGLTAKIQRRIVQTLLDASEFQDLRVGKLIIGILPLPSADFEVEPAIAPLSEEHDVIYRELKKQGRRAGKSAGDSP